jgi:hypothetical protein
MSNPWAAVGWCKRSDGAAQRHLGEKRKKGASGEDRLGKIFPDENEERRKRAVFREGDSQCYGYRQA